MTLSPALLRDLEAVPGLRLLPDAPLREHTRFRLGGPCRVLADASDEAAYVAAYRLLDTSGDPWTAIARGTNLVVSDAGYPGAVLRYSARELKAEGARVIANAGAELNDLIDFANTRGLAGMEAMAGIPGWVGAAVYGNAGAYGQSIHQRAESVRFFDGREVQEWSNAECGFAYRHSRFKDDKRRQILSIVFSYTPGDPAALSGRSREIRATRDAKFPPEMACAGSIFKNLLLRNLPEAAQIQVPPDRIIEGKVPAGWFLEQVGARGEKRGGIEVASYHANLIYNAGGGTTKDLLELLTELKRRVQDRFGFLLEEEVQFLG